MPPITLTSETWRNPPPQGNPDTLRHSSWGVHHGEWIHNRLPHNKHVRAAKPQPAPRGRQQAPSTRTVGTRVWLATSTRHTQVLGLILTRAAAFRLMAQGLAHARRLAHTQQFRRKTAAVWPGGLAGGWDGCQSLAILRLRAMGQIISGSVQYCCRSAGPQLKLLAVGFNSISNGA